MGRLRAVDIHPIERKQVRARRGGGEGGAVSEGAAPPIPPPCGEGGPAKPGRVGVPQEKLPLWLPPPRASASLGRLRSSKARSDRKGEGSRAVIANQPQETHSFASSFTTTTASPAFTPLSRRQHEQRIDLRLLQPIADRARHVENASIARDQRLDVGHRPAAKALQQRRRSSARRSSPAHRRATAAASRSDVSRNSSAATPPMPSRIGGPELRIVVKAEDQFDAAATSS